MTASRALGAFSLLVALFLSPGWTVGGEPPGRIQSSASQEEDWLLQARQAEAARDFARAAEYYVDYLKAHPDQAEVLQRLGLVYYLSNRFEEAVPPLQRALKLDQKLWGSALFLGISYYRTGQFQNALEPLRLALRLKPDLEEGRFWLGSTLFALGQNEEGISYLEKIPVGSSLAMEANSLLVQAYRKTAEDYYRRIEKVNPDSYRVHQLQAESLGWKNRDVEAIAEYRKALARNPRLEGVHGAIGDLYWRQQEFKLARKEYEEELLLAPHDPEAHLRLGQYWLANGDVNRAIKHLESVLRVTKESSDAHRDLAQAWFAKGDFGKAEPLLKTAIDMNPGDPLSHRVLADLYERTNRPGLAKQEWDQFQRLSSVEMDGVEAGNARPSEGP